jgi:hypothetical protein
MCYIYQMIIIDLFILYEEWLVNTLKYYKQTIIGMKSANILMHILIFRFNFSLSQIHFTINKNGNNISIYQTNFSIAFRESKLKTYKNYQIIIR